MPENPDTKPKLLPPFHRFFLRDGVVKPTRISESSMKSYVDDSLRSLERRARELNLTPEQVLERLTAINNAKLANLPANIARPTVGLATHKQMLDRVYHLVYDFTKGMLPYFYGDFDERPVVLPTRFGNMNLHPDLPALGNGDFGNVITGVVRVPSISKVVALLSNNAIFITDSNGMAKSTPRGMLAELIGHMVTSQCLIGILTDGEGYLFFVLKSLTRNQPPNQIVIDYYLTNDVVDPNQDQEEVAPRMVMLGLLGTMLGSGPLEYLNKKKQIFGNFKEWALIPFVSSVGRPPVLEFYFNMFKDTKKKVPKMTCADVSAPREVIYDIPKIDRLKYCQGNNFQMFSIPSRVLKNHIVWDLNLDVIAVVFDQHILQVTNKQDLEKLYSKMVDEISFYSKAKDLTGEVLQLNGAMIKIGFFVFWSKKEKSLDSYIASGPTIIFQKLTNKRHVTAEELSNLEGKWVLTVPGKWKQDTMFPRPSDGEYYFAKYNWD